MIFNSNNYLITFSVTGGELFEDIVRKFRNFTSSIIHPFQVVSSIVNLMPATVFNKFLSQSPTVMGTELFIGR